MMAGIKILGYGKAHGEVLVTNEELGEIANTDSSWVKKMTGIESRYFAKEQTNTDMAARAAQDALLAANVDPEELDVIICCTFTPDYATPSLACGVAQRLATRPDLMPFDVNGACSGFVYGFTVLDALMRAGRAKKALILGSEKISPFIDYDDKDTCFLFSDGAGAFVVESDDSKPFFALCGSEPNTDILYCPRFEPGIYMLGQGIYRFAVTRVPSSIDSLLAEAGMTKDDIDWYVLHQANERILSSIAKKMKDPPEKFFNNIKHYGNTSAASVAICLAEMFEQDLFEDGMKVIASGFGAGLTYGTMLLTI